MKKFLSLIWQKIIDHLIGVILTMIFTTSVFLEVFTKIKLLTLFVLPFFMWRWGGWIVLTIVVIILVIRGMVIKKQVNRQGRVRKPPKYHASFDRTIEDREFAGVIWKILVGTNVKPSKTELSRESVFAWPLPHSYCVECDCELERKGNNWYCMPCKKHYKIPKNLREDTWEKIRRNYERLVVQWGYNNFGIGTDDQKPLRVMLRDIKKKKAQEK